MSCEWPIMWQARRRKLAYYILIGENALWGTSRVAVNKSAKQWESHNKTSFWLPRSSQNFALLSSCGWRCCVHAACRVCAFKSLCLFSNGCVSVAAFYFCFLVYFFVILFFLVIFLSPVVKDNTKNLSLTEPSSPSSVPYDSTAVSAATLMCMTEN